MPHWPPPNQWSWHMLHAPPQSLVPKTGTNFSGKCEKPPTPVGSFACHLDTEKAWPSLAHICPHHVARTKQFLTWASWPGWWKSDSSGLNGNQRLESTCLKSGSNQYEPTPSFVWGFQADIFRGWKYFTPDLRFVCSFLGMIIPVLGRWAPLRPFILILCNARIDQHPGILVSLTFRVNLGSCFLTWLSDCVHRKLKQLDIHPVLIL